MKVLCRFLHGGLFADLPARKAMFHLLLCWFVFRLGGVPDASSGEAPGAKPRWAAREVVCNRFVSVLFFATPAASAHNGA